MSDEEDFEHEHTIAAAILQKPSRIVDVRRLTPEFFSDDDARAIFRLAHGYHEKKKGKNSLDLALARSLLEKQRSQKAFDLLGVVEEYEGYKKISPSEFEDALSNLVVSRQRRLLEKHGAKALDAILAGDLSGGQASLRQALVSAEEVVIDDRVTNLRSMKALKEERLLDKERVQDGRGFKLGFPRLTGFVSFRRKELSVLAGFLSDGKSSLAKTFAYNVNRHGARVLYISLEMTKRQMFIRFLASHAATIDPKGFDYRKIVEGRASKHDRLLFAKARKDWVVRDDKKGYSIQAKTGAPPLDIWAPEDPIDMERFCDRVKAHNDRTGVDFVVGDYLGLIDPPKTTGQYRLDLRKMANDAKRLSRQEDLHLMLAHQINQEGRTAALKRAPEHYVVGELSESIGVAQAADTIVWVLVTDEMKTQREARIGCAKSRDGNVCPQGYFIMANYPRSIMAEIDESE